MDKILKKIDEIQEYVYGTEINKGAYEDFKKELDDLRELVKNINYDTVLATGRKCIHSICALEDCPHVYNDDIICPLPS